MINKDKRMKKKDGIIDKLFNSDTNLKIIAVFFAIIIWVVVISNPNTIQQKTVRDVPISINGQSLLTERNLIIKKGLTDENNMTDVEFNTNSENIALLNKDVVNAYIDVGAIDSAGIHRLDVKATTRIPRSVPVSYSRPVIEIEVDEMISASIPVSVEFTGIRPEGYYISPPKIENSMIIINGPKSELQRVKKAVCYIDLSNQYRSINQKFDVDLLDDQENEVDKYSMASMPTLAVSVDIFPKKTVPIEYKFATQYTVSAAKDYEITDIYTMPNFVEIYGAQEELDRIYGIEINTIVNQDLSESFTVESDMIQPNANIRFVNQNQTAVQVVGVVEERQEIKRFEAIPIRIKSPPKDSTVELNYEMVDIDVKGKISEIRKLRERDIDVYVDTSDLRIGSVVELPIIVELPKEDTSLKEVANTVRTVRVTIR